MVRSWISVLASFHSTPVFGRLWEACAGITMYSVVIVFIDRLWFAGEAGIGAQLHGFLGLILGTLLVFRTNTSYDRWWEGRKLWGQLVNDSRNLAIKVQTCVRADSADKQRVGQWLIDFARALKEHLRGGARLAELPGFGGAKLDHEPKHVPAYITSRIYEQFEDWRRSDQLGGFELLFLDEHAVSLMSICGACERIQKSPISLSYRWFIRQSIAIYLLTLPWGLMRSFGWWTVLVVAMLAYFMVGIEMIAEQIEDPFGISDDDLRLDELCQTIEKSVLEIMSDAPSSADRH